MSTHEKRVCSDFVRHISLYSREVSAWVYSTFRVMRAPQETFLAVSLLSHCLDPLSHFVWETIGSRLDVFSSFPRLARIYSAVSGNPFDKRKYWTSNSKQPLDTWDKVRCFVCCTSQVCNAFDSRRNGTGEGCEWPLGDRSMISRQQKA